jgi:hypothetical protein
MGDDFMFQLFGKYRDMALAVKNPCHLNMAACLIKLKRFDEAIAQCSIVSSMLFLEIQSSTLDLYSCVITVLHFKMQRLHYKSTHYTADLHIFSARFLITDFTVPCAYCKFAVICVRVN